MENEKCLA